MQKAILLLFFLCFSNYLLAQTIRFSKYFDLMNISTNETGKVEVLPQGYAFLSYVNCTDTSTCTVFAITDTLGELLQQKTFPGLLLEDLRYHPEDSSFLLWGRSVSISNPDAALYMLKINYQGETLWSFTINPPQVDFCHQALELPDKSILLATAPESWTGNEATIIKTDSVGHLLWIKGYDTGNYFKSYDVQSLISWKDSTVLFCATGRRANTPDGSNLDSGVALFQIDYNGNILYDTAYRIDGTINLSGHARLAKITNNRIVTSSCNELFNPSHSGTNLIAIQMEDKSIDWVLGFSESGGHATILRLYTTLDSGIIAGGYTYTDLFPITLPTAWFLKVKPTGQIEWQRFLPNTLGYIVGDIKPTPDGGYILTVSYRDSDFYGYAGLIKIDGNGCLQPNCDSLLITTRAEEQEQLLPALKIQPNPTEGLFTVNTEGFDGGRLRIVDMLGYIVKEVPVTDRQTMVSVSHCANGIYAIQYLDAMGKIRSVGRVAIQH